MQVLFQWNDLKAFDQANITRCLFLEFHGMENHLRVFHNILWFSSWENLQNVENTCLQLYFLHLPCSLQILSVMKVKCMVSASYFFLCRFMNKMITISSLDYFINNKCWYYCPHSYKNVKNFSWSTCGKIFFEAIFLTFFSKFSSSFYGISLAEKIFYFLSANHYPKLRCVIYNNVTLFQLMLHLNCIALSQSESSIFFHVYY